jgi:hypothetical protein
MLHDNEPGRGGALRKCDGSVGWPFTGMDLFRRFRLGKVPDITFTSLLLPSVKCPGLAGWKRSFSLGSIGRVRTCFAYEN